jgi:monoamine oxidase
VSKVHQAKNGLCEVVTSDGTVFSAKKVIVSVPTCTLTNIDFDPPLPPNKLLLSRQTALGYYAKTIFVFDRPWWREAKLSGIMSSQEGPISFSRDTCVPEDKQYSITCFIVGDSGRRWSKWSAAARRRIVAEHFDSFFGEAARAVGVAVPVPINVIEKEWIKDPWSQGAPSPVTTLGTLTEDSGKAIREPWKNVHFVGTETALVWKGYMEGAVRSGMRGAREVIEELLKFTSNL